jgi:hypothetical protein
MSDVVLVQLSVRGVRFLFTRVVGQCFFFFLMKVVGQQDKACLCREGWMMYT